MVGVLIIALLLLPPALEARKFYRDDPIQVDPKPHDTPDVKRRKLSDYYDLFAHLFGHPGERQPPGKPITAGGVNTLGEVPDGPWYNTRHWAHAMSMEELRRGPGDQDPPSMEGPWDVLAGKTEGVTPGFLMRDSRGNRYFIKFDPPTNPEMATAADVIGSKFFYALGYYTPSNYIVTFNPERLRIDPKAVVPDELGRDRPMTSRDLTMILLKVAPQGATRIRATASKFLDGRPVGPYRYYGTRRDDPNDIVPHEHRRDLRGLYVFAAWLGHDDSRAINTLDTIVEQGSIHFIRHHLIDFGSILGSASEKPNSARSGNEYLFSFKPALAEIFTLGLYAPAWTRAYFPDLPAVGRFEYKVFNPDRYRPEYPNPAFQNRLRDDEYWAARQVMSFSDEQIRELVKQGQYSDPEAEAWIVKCLVERRNKIGRTFVERVLPLDRFRIEDDELRFEDLGVTHRFAGARKYTIAWSNFDNEHETRTEIPGAANFRVPATESEYLVAGIHGGDAKKSVTVYLRRQGGPTWRVVGIERSW